MGAVAQWVEHFPLHSLARSRGPQDEDYRIVIEWSRVRVPPAPLPVRPPELGCVSSRIDRSCALFAGRWAGHLHGLITCGPRVRLPPLRSEGTAAWAATGLENRGSVTAGGSTPLPSSVAEVERVRHQVVGLEKWVRAPPATPLWGMTVTVTVRTFNPDISVRIRVPRLSRSSAVERSSDTREVLGSSPGGTTSNGVWPTQVRHSVVTRAHVGSSPTAPVMGA
jgi:hypothetical protein